MKKKTNEETRLKTHQLSKKADDKLVSFSFQTKFLRYNQLRISINKTSKVR